MAKVWSKVTKVSELTTISALLDDPDSISKIAPGEITTNFAKMYAKRPKGKFPYKIVRNKKGTFVHRKDPNNDSNVKTIQKISMEVHEMSELRKKNVREGLSGTTVKPGKENIGPNEPGSAIKTPDDAHSEKGAMAAPQTKADYNKNVAASAGSTGGQSAPPVKPQIKNPNLVKKILDMKYFDPTA